MYIVLLKGIEKMQVDDASVLLVALKEHCKESRLLVELVSLS